MEKLQGLDEVAGYIRENNDFGIVHHYDADGICSAAITAIMLKRLGKKFTYTSVKQMDSKRVKLITELAPYLIFVDIGSGQIPVLEKELSGKKFAIIDHHKMAANSETKTPHFNPHLSNIDGTTEISGAGCCYLVAKHIDEKNKDLAKLAIIGAIGDIQDSKGKLEGLNREILKDAEENKDVREFIDLKMFGRHSRPLVNLLSYCTEPYLPGLTAKEDECRAFLNNISIPLQRDEKWLTYSDLTQDEKKRLVTALYVHGKQHDLPESDLKSLVGEVYELVNEKNGTELKDAKEFATVLNACGRHENTDIGVRVCIGDRDLFLTEAVKLLEKHRKMLHDAIAWVQDNGVNTMQNIYVLDAGNMIPDSLIGVIAGMLYGSGVILHDKPIIAMAIDEEGMTKISGRATWALVGKGLDLSKAMRSASEKTDGEGGGHTVAAGARIPNNKKEEFLAELDKIIGEQINGKHTKDEK